MLMMMAVLVHGLTLGGAETVPFLAQDDMAFLEFMTKAVLAESRVAAGARVGGYGPNVTGNTLIRPGGREDYPAFWIRDYAMSLEAGLITLEEQRHALFLTAKHQPDEEISLPSGSVVPPGSIPDHIGFRDVPIFFPGVLDDYEKQGGAQWGKLPSLDDAFFFIHMAMEYARQSGESAFLREAVKGKPLLQRLEEAYAMPPAHPESGIVQVTAEARGVNFGFFDTVVHTGDLFFASLLKYRAAGELAELFGRLGETEKATKYQAAVSRLQQALVAVFSMEDGWFRASTGTSAQVDVWGTAFAVFIGALPAEREKQACAALTRAVREGTIAWRGMIRHVPTDRDFSPESAWEKCYARKNTYQNGAYWDTATGWVCYAVAKQDRALSRDLAKDYVAELREGDFRKGKDFGSPWECVHPEGNHRQNPIYLASVTGPLAAFRQIK